jgi:hypothetical protein
MNRWISLATGRAILVPFALAKPLPQQKRLPAQRGYANEQQEDTVDLSQDSIEPNLNYLKFIDLRLGKVDVFDL